MRRSQGKIYFLIIIFLLSSNIEAKVNYWVLWDTKEIDTISFSMSADALKDIFKSQKRCLDESKKIIKKIKQDLDHKKEKNEIHVIRKGSSYYSLIIQEKKRKELTEYEHKKLLCLPGNINLLPRLYIKT